MRKAQLKREAFKSDENVFRIEIEEEKEENEGEEEKKKDTESNKSLMEENSKINKNLHEFIPKDQENSKIKTDFNELIPKDQENSNIKKDFNEFIPKDLSLKIDNKFEEIKANELRNSVRRLTLPVTNIELEKISLKGSLKNLSPATSPASFSFFNFKTEKRRPSIANIAIGKSIAPSLAGIFPDPTNLLNHEGINNGDLRRSLTDSNLSDNSTGNNGDDVTSTDGQKKSSSGRRWSRIPFLRPQDDCIHRSHHHLNIPIITFNGPATYGGSGRKFNFGIRRHSHLVSQEVLDDSNNSFYQCAD